MFAAEGLAEYYFAEKAAAAEKSKDGPEQADPATVSATEAMHECLTILQAFITTMDDPERDGGEGYLPKRYPGVRTAGHHMVVLRLITQLLRRATAEDEELWRAKGEYLEAVQARMVDSIMNKFYNPQYDLNNEALQHDYARPDDENEDFVYLGHAIEIFWMVMDELQRRKEDSGVGADERAEAAETFELAATRMHRHIEVAWDRVFGGIIRGAHVGDPRSCNAKRGIVGLRMTQATENGAEATLTVPMVETPVGIGGQWDKVLWAQEEAGIGCLLAYEVFSAEGGRGGEGSGAKWGWAVDWFRKIDSYIEGKFRLRPHGYVGYKVGGDRRVLFVENYNMGYPWAANRKENYHHPR
jgi:hypothetical protein